MSTRYIIVYDDGIVQYPDTLSDDMYLLANCGVIKIIQITNVIKEFNCESQVFEVV